MDLSVILCTHNPRQDHLARTLAALRSQTLTTDRWELLLIDNNSKELIADHWDLSWHPHGIHVQEPSPGKLAAMLTGMERATGDVIVTVDDDNILDPNYLEVAAQKIAAHPKVGVWSGNNRGEFEEAPTPYKSAFTPYLAINEETKDHHSSDIEHAYFPIGAGMVLRSDLARIYCTHMRSTLATKGTLLNRAPGRLHAGQEDTEVGILAIKSGFACGRTPDLKLVHIIPRNRLQLSYLFRLVRSISLSHALIYRSHGIRQPFWTTSTQVRNLASSFARLIYGALCFNPTAMGRASVNGCSAIGKLQVTLGKYR
jgi:glycosyltransferase involved in cell wall biosynthesis